MTIREGTWHDQWVVATFIAELYILGLSDCWFDIHDVEELPDWDRKIYV